MQKITQSYLKSILNYNPDTGVFTWKSPRKGIKICDIAGSVKENGYMRISINKKHYYAHRLAWMYIYGEFPSEQIDHVNHDRTDNRIANLRVVSHAENGRNQSKRITNTSGHVGVSWNKQLSKWQAHIVVNYKRIHLGFFADINEAIAVRKQAEIHYGFHQNHGIAA